MLVNHIIQFYYQKKEKDEIEETNPDQDIQNEYFQLLTILILIIARLACLYLFRLLRDE